MLHSDHQSQGSQSRRNNPYQHYAADYFNPYRIVPCPFFSHKGATELLRRLSLGRIPDEPVDLAMYHQVCRLADPFGLPHPVKRLFLGQLPTRGLTIIHRALKEVLDQFGISVLLVDMLKEGRKGNCAKIVVLAGHAQDVQLLLHQRFTIQQSHGVLFSAPRDGYVTCEPERTSL